VKKELIKTNKKGITNWIEYPISELISFN